MYFCHPQQSQRRCSTQQGMVLVVGLVMVLLITIIGVSAIRGSGLQESMAGNMRDRNIAFQAAESALREGEAIIGPSVKTLPPFKGAEGTGLWQDLSETPANSIIYWTKDNWASMSKETDLEFEDVTASPRYVVEEIEVDIAMSARADGSGVDIHAMQSTGDATPYRVTAQGFGISPDTDVVLQSTYKRPF